MMGGGGAWLLEPIQAEQKHPSLVLRQWLVAGEHFVVPGVFLPVVALQAAKIGFRVLYVSGAAFSASSALPDLGVFTLSELVAFVGRVYDACGLPLVVDADTGFGEALNCARTARELFRAGAAALQIEDQEFPKKCGHLEGKRVVPAEEFIVKIKAVKDVCPEMLIVARTDARTVHSLQEAIDRAHLYREAGAEIIFPEALTSEEEFRQFSREMGGWLLANMTEFGKTPYISADAFFQMGYQMVVFPVTALRAALKTTYECLRELFNAGTQKHFLERLMTRKEFYELIEYGRYEAYEGKLAQTLTTTKTATDDSRK